MNEVSEKRGAGTDANSFVQNELDLLLCRRLKLAKQTLCKVRCGSQARFLRRNGSGRGNHARIGSPDTRGADERGPVGGAAGVGC